MHLKMIRPRRFAFLVGGMVALSAAAAPRNIYRIDTVAGSGQTGDGGLAIAAQIGNIQAVALDGWGNIYLSDTDNHRVRRVDTAGVIRTVAGTGTPGFSGDGGPATDARLNFPYGLAVGPDGSVFVADLGNGRVRRIGPDGVITTVAGNGQKDPTGEGRRAVDASLLTPRNLALDPEGNLYIAEFDGHRIRRVSPDGGISTVAGSAAPGFRGDGGPAVVAQLAYPAGLAVDGHGVVYVADSKNQRVRKILPSGTIATVLGGTPATALFTPTAITLDANGNLYVADATRTIRAYTATGAWVAVAGTGEPGFAGDGGPARSAKLTAPRDLAADSGGNLYLADGVRIRKISKGTIQTIAGDGYLRAIGDGGVAIGAELLHPSDVALDSIGNLYIADTGTHRIRQVSRSGVITTFVGTGVPGSAADRTSVAVAQVNAPMGLTVDSLGLVVIADTLNNRVWRAGLDGRVRTIAGAGAGSLQQPRGLCAARDGTLYVADTLNHRVLRLVPDGTPVTVAGSGSAGDAGDGGSARQAQLSQPSACALNSAGDLFIADTLNHRIRKVSPDGTISAVAGDGTAGQTGDGGPAVSARLQAPAGIAVDDDGNVFISDSGNHRIRQVTPDGTIYTIAGTGVAGFSGDGEAASAVQLNSPSGLRLDGSGHLYVADTLNNRIRRLAPDGVVVEPLIAPAGLTVENAASLASGPVAPGELVVIFGDGLGLVAGKVGAPDSAGVLSGLVGGTEVWFDGIAAPVFYAQVQQVNVQVPYSIAGKSQTNLEIHFNSKLAGRATLPVAAAAPGLFPVVLNDNGSPNSETEPADATTVLTFYATGEGLTDGSNIAGKASTAPYARPTLPVSMIIGGLAPEILYAGSAPEYIGLLQVNASVPAALAGAGKVTAALTVGSATSPEIAVWVK